MGLRETERARIFLGCRHCVYLHWIKRWDLCMRKCLLPGTKARLMKGRVWHPMLRRLEVPLQLSSYWPQVYHGWPMSRPTQLQSRRCPVSLQIVNALELLSRECRHPSSRSQSSHEIPQRPLSQSQPLKTRCCSSSILSEKEKSWRKWHAKNLQFDKCFLGPQESFHMRKKGTR